MNFYITEKTAKQLKDWGCEIEPEKSFCVKKKYKDSGVIELLVTKGRTDAFQFVYEIVYPAYHLLEDICVTRAKEFFGEWYNARSLEKTSYIEQILNLMAIGQKEEAEQYILDNCIFNPKNK